jgi:hypothetical protein
MKQLKIKFALTSEQIKLVRPNIIERLKLDVNPTIEIGYLLSENAKTVKGHSLGYLTRILHLSPANSTLKEVNLCSHSTKACRSSCLAYSGHMGLTALVNNAQHKRTLFYYFFKEEFFKHLKLEIDIAQLIANQTSSKLAIRLNGTSDIDFREFILNNPSITFYDYTKVPFYFKDKPVNHDLTFSFSGYNWPICENVLKSGHNISVVFLKTVPLEYKGFKVISGDNTDLRFLDEKGCIVGLKYKTSRKALNILSSDIENNKFIVR